MEAGKVVDEYSLLLDQWCEKLEALLVREPGHHKIKGNVAALYKASGRGQLLAVAKQLLDPEVDVVALLVGSPNCTIMWPPTDTDGPGGAVALTRTLLRLNRRVILVSDEVNHEQVVEPFKKAGFNVVEREDFDGTTLNNIEANRLPYVQFHCQRNWTEVDDEKLQHLYDAVQFIINVGRPGPAEDGQTRAHDKANMTGFDAKFKNLYTRPEKFALRPEHRAYTAVIGELGNELGMGAHLAFVKENVENGIQIGCNVAGDFTIIATTATWGAWGLCAMLALLAERTQKIPVPLSELLPDLREQKLVLKSLVEEGARCGLTWTRDEIVDRFTAEENWKFLNDLKSETLSFVQEITQNEEISQPVSQQQEATPVSQERRDA